MKITHTHTHTHLTMSNLEYSLHPPLRFSLVQPDLYRGSYPRPHNEAFLDGLGLKTIISVTPSPISDPWLLKYAEANDIELIHVPSSASTKKKNVPVDHKTVRVACQHMLDAQKAPLYVHCLNGTHVTGIVVACLRKLSFWSTAAIADEYVRMTGGAQMGTEDRVFVEGFSGRVEMPDSVVDWAWKGLSKKGIVQNNPTFTIDEKS